MRLRGRENFHFRTPRHFFLTHLDLYLKRPSPAQPAIHTVIPGALPDAFVTRVHVARSPISCPQQSLWGRHFPLRYTARSRRSSFIFLRLHTCPMMSHFFFRCLTCISFFFSTCFKSLLLFKGVVCMNKVVVSSILVLMCACVHSSSTRPRFIPACSHATSVMRWPRAPCAAHSYSTLGYGPCPSQLTLSMQVIYNYN
jgi:hypothetical protein